MGILENLAEIKRAIVEVSLRGGRDSEEVTLVAVTKTKPIECIYEAIHAGQSVFGESYVQEAREKIDALRSEVALIDNLEKGVDFPRFHFIGRLQQNKVKKTVGFFDVIESVHKRSLADAISLEAKKKGIEQLVFVQVNISEQDAKSGVMPDEVREFCSYVLTLPGLKLGGLMAIGTFHEESAPRNIRCAEFEHMLQLKKDVEQSLGFPIKDLSMGMSHDFELAIECGATVVRVGSAIFGER